MAKIVGVDAREHADDGGRHMRAAEHRSPIVFRPPSAEIGSGGADSIAAWVTDAAYDEEGDLVRQAC